MILYHLIYELLARLSMQFADFWQIAYHRKTAVLHGFPKGGVVWGYIYPFGIDIYIPPIHPAKYELLTRPDQPLTGDAFLLVVPPDVLSHNARLKGFLDEQQRRAAVKGVNLVTKGVQGLNKVIRKTGVLIILARKLIT
jgi:hypothetical protein